MRKLFIGILAIAVVFGMSMGVMAGNEATIDQDGLDLQADVGQEGDRNIIELIQDGDANDSLANAILSQYGTENEAYVEQEHDNFGVGVRARIDQDGIGNLVNVNQTFNSNLEIWQDGNNNEAQVNITQDHSAWKNQDFIATYLNQEGDGNIYEAEKNVGTSWSEQIGDDNEVYINQVTSGQPGNLDIYQEGDRNVVNATQLGTEHTADLNQTGNDDRIVLTQDGENNDVEVVQTDF